MEIESVESDLRDSYVGDIKRLRDLCTNTPIAQEENSEPKPDIEIKDKKALVKRQLEDGYELIEVQMPCLLTAVNEFNKPRYMSIFGIEDAHKKEITVWNNEDIKLDPKDCGLNASPTQVFRSFTPPLKGKGKMLSGSVSEMSDALLSELKEKHIL